MMMKTGRSSLSGWQKHQPHNTRRDARLLAWGGKKCSNENNKLPKASRDGGSNCTRFPISRGLILATLFSSSSVVNLLHFQPLLRLERAIQVIRLEEERSDQRHTRQGAENDIDGPV